jgi:OTU domain-containing protein 6
LPGDHANYKTTRQTAANYIYTHPDDFLPFLPTGEDEGAVPPGSGIMTPALFQDYCVRMRDTGVWGGEPEITALCRAYNIPINVVQGTSPFVVVHSPSGETITPNPKEAVNISYHRNLYGLGEVRHYVIMRLASPYLQGALIAL